MQVAEHVGSWSGICLGRVRWWVLRVWVLGGALGALTLGACTWGEVLDCQDLDGDGYTVDEGCPRGEPGGDCDDENGSVYPGAPEALDGLDTDCDEQVPAIEMDGDGDGYTMDVDCDDSRPDIYPGHVETCDSVDNDCDASIDEGLVEIYYEDRDDDGFGDTDYPIESCLPEEEWTQQSGDCDDTRADRFPLNPETCDSVDNDCDASIDEGLVEIYYEDRDGDGFGDTDYPIESCLPQEEWTQQIGDCDDTEARRFPGNPEACDTLDNDCDVAIDEELMSIYYEDRDGDGRGDPGSTQLACDPAPGWLPIAGDCDDSDPTMALGKAEICDGKDNDCDGAPGIEETDHDSDGYLACQGAWVECDDKDPDVHSGAAEICDAQDNDCDGRTDEGFDLDGDGYTTCPLGSGTDCDDQSATTFPGAPERCGDGVDNDCDQRIDESIDSDRDGWPACLDCQDHNAAIHPGAVDLCGDEIDNDCSGLAEDGDFDGDGAACYQDCDDASPLRRPGAEEICDGVDNDCDLAVDERDEDGDGQPSLACGGSDCDDQDGTRYLRAAEVCDGVDQDCDGAIDEGVVDTFYVDDDGDGVGADDSALIACTAPSGYVSRGHDCDDSDANVYPGCPESCDGSDNDCDGSADEGLAGTWYHDADGDGYGSDLLTVKTCTQPAGASSVEGDCDDGDANIYPSCPERCDGVDGDCDGAVDEAFDVDGDGCSSTCDTFALGDCDDNDPTSFEGAREICEDGKDNDCDGIADGAACRPRILRVETESIARDAEIFWWRVYGENLSPEGALTTDLQGLEILGPMAPLDGDVGVEVKVRAPCEAAIDFFDLWYSAPGLDVPFSNCEEAELDEGNMGDCLVRAYAITPGPTALSLDSPIIPNRLTAESGPEVEVAITGCNIEFPGLLFVDSFECKPRANDCCRPNPSGDGLLRIYCEFSPIYPAGSASWSVTATSPSLVEDGTPPPPDVCEVSRLCDRIPDVIQVN